MRYNTERTRQVFKRLQAPGGLLLALMIIWAAACCTPFQTARVHMPSAEMASCHPQAAPSHDLSHADAHHDCQCLHPHKQNPVRDGQGVGENLQAISAQSQSVCRDTLFHSTGLPGAQTLYTPRPPPDSSGLWQRLASPPVFYTSTVLLI